MVWSLGRAWREGMPSLSSLAPRGVVLSIWLAGLAALACREGLHYVASVLVLGSLPMLFVSSLYANVLAPITGLMTRSTVDDELQRERERCRRASNATQEDVEALDHTLSSESVANLAWLEFLVCNLWPSIAKYVENKIRSYEPMIKTYVPLLGDSIHFQTCRVGSEPIRFRCIRHRPVTAHYDGRLLDLGGVELLIDISYLSDVEILLTSPIASLGVSNLTISGVLSVVLRPLMEKIPFIGGIEVLFTNPPQVDVDFKGIGSIAQMPGVREAVMDLINDAIAKTLVAPNRIAYAISQDAEVDLARLRCPHPIGVLQLIVHRGEKLEARDFRVLGPSTSDPYVKVRVGGAEWRTPTVWKTCNPTWTEGNSYDMFVFSAQQRVQIDVLDEDPFFKKDDGLGSINGLSMEKLIHCAQEDAGPIAWKLERHHTEQRDPPEDARLWLELRWLLLSDGDLEESLRSQDHRHVLALKVDEICGLPDEGLCAPFKLRLRLDAQPQDLRASRGRPRHSWPQGREQWPAGGVERRRFGSWRGEFKADSSPRGSPGISRVSEAVSGVGWARASVEATTETLQRVRKLVQSGVSATLIADVMTLDKDLVDKVIEQWTASGSTTSSYACEDDEAWIARMRSSRAKVEQSRRPQFKEVLRIILPVGMMDAVLELVNSQGKVVAYFHIDAREIASAKNKNRLEGPFELRSSGIGNAQEGKDVPLLIGDATLFQLTAGVSGWSLQNTQALQDDHAVLQDRVELLDPELCSSVREAVERLSSGELLCDQGYCAVRSKSSGQIYLIFRGDRRLEVGELFNF